MWIRVQNATIICRGDDNICVAEIPFVGNVLAETLPIEDCGIPNDFRDIGVNRAEYYAVIFDPEDVPEVAFGAMAVQTAYVLKTSCQSYAEEN
jgi:hypothetical protein